MLVKEGIFEKISSLLKTESNNSITVNCIRIISVLCKSNLPRVSKKLFVVFIALCS